MITLAWGRASKGSQWQGKGSQLCCVSNSSDAKANASCQNQKKRTELLHADCVSNIFWAKVSRQNHGELARDQGVHKYCDWIDVT